VLEGPRWRVCALYGMKVKLVGVGGILAAGLMSGTGPASGLLDEATVMPCPWLR
jgi:hypothetical protein